MAFSVLMRLAEQNPVIVEFVAGHEVVDDARHLVGGVGDRLRGADAGTFAAKELSERRVAAVERLGAMRSACAARLTPGPV